MIISDLEYIEFIPEQASAINGGITEVSGKKEISTVKTENTLGTTSVETVSLASNDRSVAEKLLKVLPMAGLV